MNLELLKRRTGRFLKQNSPTILSGIAVAGVIATVYSTIKATTKANVEINGVENEVYLNEDRELTTREKIRVGAKYYVPVVFISGGTIACILGANVLNKKQQAMLTAAYISLENSFREYKSVLAEKSVENADENGEFEDLNDTVTREILKKHFSDAPIPQGDELLWWDDLQNVYFTSTMEKVIYAEQELKKIDAQLGFVDVAVLHCIEGSPGLPISYYVRNVEFSHQQTEIEDDITGDKLLCIVRKMEYDEAYIPKE